MNTKKNPVVEFRNIDRYYVQVDKKLVILEQANFSLMPGEMVALVSPSGTGKSTLLHIAGLLENPNAGDVILFGHSCINLVDAERAALRCSAIGFIYQFHHLLPEFTAIENVMLPVLIKGKSMKEASARAKFLLEVMHLEHRKDHLPSELSGGEQQRVAIARAVANQPSLLLADEPTGNLDEKTANSVFASLQQLVYETGLSALIATHNFELAKQMDRQVTLENRKIVPLI